MTQALHKLLLASLLFATAAAATPPSPEQALAWLDALPEPDTSDWSEKRIADFRTEAASDANHDLPEALMRIPSVGIELPVFNGTEERHLTLGAGRIEGTPPLASGGNTGLAAHRDGYFRALKDVRIDDAIFVETPDGTHEYRIVDLFVVDPYALHVLDQTDADTITIVTCYPFYFVGNAPERYIVRAEKR